MKKFLAVIFMVVGVVLYAPEKAHACTCMQPTVQEAFDRATAVFVGKPITYEHSDPPPQTEPTDVSEPFQFQMSTSTFTFEVSKVWKGNISKTVVAETVYNDQFINCNITYFEHDREYLIYATGDKDRLQAATICTMTKPLAVAQNDIKQLDKLAAARVLGSYDSYKEIPFFLRELTAETMPWFVARIVLGVIVFLSFVIGVIALVVFKTKQKNKTN